MFLSLPALQVQQKFVCVIVFLKKTLGNRKIVSDLSASTVQTVITQLFGLAIFYITSRYLSKEDYGELNWSTATGSTILAFASLGLDLVLVKLIASGKHAATMGGIHLFHNICSGLLLCVIFALWHYLLPYGKQHHAIFFIVFVNLTISNVANSLKLTLNGLEKYGRMAITALWTSATKFVLVFLLYIAHLFTVLNVVYAFIGAAVVELSLSYYYAGRSAGAYIKPVLLVQEYRALVMRSLPQLAVVIFDSALARIDWILLGIISTAAITAEYSFAYRIFELSKLPLLIIAPVLLTRFSKLFNTDNDMDEKKIREIQLFFGLEMFVSMLIPVALVCVWSPLMDLLTDHKYGAVNETTYMILSACIPMHYIINFLWTMAFAQGQLKTLMYITIASSALNVVLNCALIPVWGGIGSAWAFLASTLLQLTLYTRLVRQKQVKLNGRVCLLAFMNALLAVLMARYLFQHAAARCATALITYGILAFATKQLNLKSIRQH